MAEEGFLGLVLDNLADLGPVRARSMFGGTGLYLEDTFFGVVYDDRLFFKTNDETRDRFLNAGMGPFQPNPKQTIKTYYEVPGDVIEDSASLTEWAEEAIDIAAESK